MMGVAGIDDRSAQIRLRSLDTVPVPVQSNERVLDEIVSDPGIPRQDVRQPDHSLAIRAIELRDRLAAIVTAHLDRCITHLAPHPLRRPSRPNCSTTLITAASQPDVERSAQPAIASTELLRVAMTHLRRLVIRVAPQPRSRSTSAAGQGPCRSAWSGPHTGGWCRSRVGFACRRGCDATTRRALASDTPVDMGHSAVFVGERTAARYTGRSVLVVLGDGPDYRAQLLCGSGRPPGDLVAGPRVDSTAAVGARFRAAAVCSLLRRSAVDSRFRASGKRRGSQGRASACEATSRAGVRVSGRAISSRRGRRVEYSSSP